ncbi:hypothetical protein [Microbacterium sp. XT11]|uniref:hypothetical protein n=1 Tax=Microbacterium sp. XT11 TaxID=367477 RepID=UPI0008321468|nr:hypothetical protein [Microbacterium sp. XT11]
MVTPTTRRERRAALRGRTSVLLTPKFRKWAYGVTAAALALAIAIGWVPVGASPVVLPLLMAVFYVDETGNPKEDD